MCVISQHLIEGECTEQDAYVQKWSSEEVSSWLRKQGFNEEADIFHGLYAMLFSASSLEFKTESRSLFWFQLSLQP